MQEVVKELVQFSLYVDAWGNPKWVALCSEYVGESPFFTNGESLLLPRLPLHCVYFEAQCLTDGDLFIFEILEVSIRKDKDGNII